jgi:hypothetical protein
MISWDRINPSLKMELFGIISTLFFQFSSMVFTYFGFIHFLYLDVRAIPFFLTAYFLLTSCVGSTISDEGKIGEKKFNTSKILNFVFYEVIVANFILTKVCIEKLQTVVSDITNVTNERQK